MINILIYIIPIFVCNNNLRNLENSLILNKDNWEYNSIYGIFYQFNITYCTNPAFNNNKLSIYVPKKYLLCSKLNSIKYSCSINLSGKFGNYTTLNAPIVLPIYNDSSLATINLISDKYDKIRDFLSAGFIYIYVGFRNEYDWNNGYVSGAPWGITDLKAAIRFIRYNSDLIPGDMNSIFSFGFSGGGAQSCLLGITGNSELYKNYLNNIGAVMYYNNGTPISDAIKGSQCWCPITNLDTADMSYEWNIGQYFTTSPREPDRPIKTLSRHLTTKYIEYINLLGLKLDNGTILSLSTTDSSSYYVYLKSVIQTSLNNFLSDTTFPYISNSNYRFDGWNEVPSDASSTYETVLDYINYLNSDEHWVDYNSSFNNATITNVGSFVKKCKNPTRGVGAFDDIYRQQIENQLFGFNHSYTKAHFDNYILEILDQNYFLWEDFTYYYGFNWNYINDYRKEVFYSTDSLGNSNVYRVNMYNPMYYICDYYSGYKSSDVASYFRINSGINQGETSNCVEMNLALALKNFNKSVEFTTVWDQGHTTAERKGSKNSITNFISWVNRCMGILDSKNLNTDYSNNNLDTISNNYYYSKINKKNIILLLFLLI